MTVSKALLGPGKAALVFLALMAASVVGGMIFYAGYVPPEGAREFDGLAMMRAGIIVHAANAILLAVLASWSRLSRLGTVALLAALLFVAQTFLSLMETVFFNEFFGMPLDDAPRNLGVAALTAFAGSTAATFLFAAKDADNALFEPSLRASLAWRFPLAVALYPAAYWAAGLFFVVSSETATAFYGETLTSRIEPGPLLAFQLVRGTIWAALALWAVYGLRDSRVTRGILVGAAFAIFMVLPLLYPNPYMPAAVRMVHFVEIGISNFIYGFVVAMLLSPMPKHALAA